MIDDALERSERTEERWCVAELLRIKGDLARLEGAAIRARLEGAAIRIAEDHYLQALEWARRQEALSWKLRAATSLADPCHQTAERGAGRAPVFRLRPGR